MPITYPIQAPQAGGTSKPGNGYFNYAVGFFTEDASLTTGSAYTASVSTSAWLFFVSSSVTSGSTINIQLPTASLIINSNLNDPTFYSPAIEFWRLDNESNVIVNLVTNTGSVTIGTPFNSTSSYSLPTSSYTTLTQLDLGNGIVWVPTIKGSI